MNVTKSGLSRDIAELLECGIEVVSDSTTFSALPSWDSMAQLKILLHLEDCYGIEISESVIMQAQSLDGIMKLIALADKSE